MRPPAGAIVGLPFAWMADRSCVSSAVRLDLRLELLLSIDPRLAPLLWDLFSLVVVARCRGAVGVEIDCGIIGTACCLFDGLMI
jgi:hypothetical protein